MILYRFFINDVPPSINGAYGGKAKRYLSPKVKKFKKKVEQAIYADPKSYFAGKALSEKKLVFNMYVCKKDWFTKDGRVKRNDITNRIKIFEDAVMEALGLDDSHVWSFHVHKISSTFDATYCEISDTPPGHTDFLPVHLSRELDKLQAEADNQPAPSE